MPRASRSSSQKHPASQPRTSRTSTRQRSGPTQQEEVPQSQGRLEDFFPTASQLQQQPVDSEDHVNNLVRYLVCNAGSNPKQLFRRADLQKQASVVKSGAIFQQVLNRVADILKNVYGYNLLVCDQIAQHGKAYIVSNAMPYLNYDITEQESPENRTKILLLLVLSHIFMSNGNVTDSSLFSFLKLFKIDERRHPLFGMLKEAVTSFVKQKYLAVETDSISDKVSYRWGLRAEKEVSKHEILEFACKFLKNGVPKAWTKQFQAAEEQGFENVKMLTNNDNDMEVDE